MIKKIVHFFLSQKRFNLLIRCCILLVISTYFSFENDKPIFANTLDRLASNILEESPPFLTAPQILEDISVYEELLKDNYSRYDILKEQGIDWENVFFRLKVDLTSSNKKILTQNLLKGLIQTLSFTKDGSFTAEMDLHKRHYQASIGNDYFPSYANIKVVKQDQRFRFAPGSAYPKTANQWFVKCNSDLLRFFPVVPERKGEQRFVLGVFFNQPQETVNCQFEDNLGQMNQETFSLRSYKSAEFTDSQETELFNWSPGQIPYVHWKRDGKSNAEDTRRFFNILPEIRKHRTFILDVSGNTTGSFNFIAQWLGRLTKNSWKNTIIKEKQSQSTLEGLLNRLEYKRANTEISLQQRKELDKEKLRIFARLRYLESGKIPLRYVKTSFSFSGNPDARSWNKRMVVVANRQCGTGCQFLIGLAKQQENSFFLGENTGTFPRKALIPLYQLPHSKIRISINHRIHLDHKNRPVPPSGYEPDFWLDHPSLLSEIYRLARSEHP